MTEAPFPDSLCHRCRFLRIVRTARSAFLMCQEPSLPKYTGQPVRACRGFVPRPEGEGKGESGNGNGDGNGGAAG